MTLAPIHEAYGRYLLARDRLDSVLDAAIIQETQLRVFHGVLLVAHLSTKSALGVLKGVLVQAGGDRAKAAMASVKALHALLKQHPLGQSTCRVSADTWPPSIDFTTLSTCWARGSVRTVSYRGQLARRAPGT